jgi:fumarate reductase subunit C
MYILKFQKYVIKKYFQIFLLVSKLLLNYFEASFKQWLQSLKNPFIYFSLIR